MVTYHDSFAGCSHKKLIVVRSSWLREKRQRVLRPESIVDKPIDWHALLVTSALDRVDVSRLDVGTFARLYDTNDERRTVVPATCLSAHLDTQRHLSVLFVVERTIDRDETTYSFAMVTSRAAPTRSDWMRDDVRRDVGHCSRRMSNDARH
jgi:hypothetical protein